MPAEALLHGPSAFVRRTKAVFASKSSRAPAAPDGHSIRSMPQHKEQSDAAECEPQGPPEDPPTCTAEAAAPEPESDQAEPPTPPPSSPGHAAAPAASRAPFPANEHEEQVVAALRTRFEDVPAGRLLPHDMLYGFVRSTEPKSFKGGTTPSNPGHETRKWSEAAIKTMKEALSLLDSYQARVPRRSCSAHLLPPSLSLPTFSFSLLLWPFPPSLSLCKKPRKARACLALTVQPSPKASGRRLPKSPVAPSRPTCTSSTPTPSQRLRMSKPLAPRSVWACRLHLTRPACARACSPVLAYSCLLDHRLLPFLLTQAC
jgi:hypothetical protein